MLVGSPEPAALAAGPRRRGPFRTGVLQLGTAGPFLAIKLTIFTTFVVIPFVYTLILTFQRGNLLTGMRWVGFENYVSILTDTLFWTSLRNTILYLAVAVPVTLVLSCAVGLLLAGKMRGLKVHRSLIYLPALLSLVATAIIWKVMVNPTEGPLALFFSELLGIAVPWLSDGVTALVFIALISAWSSCGFFALIFMAGFNSVPSETIEAARIDGAGRWQILTHIKLPQITPVIQVVIVLLVINGVQVFDLVFVLTKGGPGTATYTAMWYVYQNAFNGGSIAYAATMSVLLLLLTAGLSAALVFRRRKVGDIA